MMGFLSSPVATNLLYVMLVAGIWLAVMSVITPGTGVYEASAALLLGVVGLGTLWLAVNTWALLLLLLGLVFFGLSLWRWRPGLWLVLSALAFSSGSVFLFRLEGRAIAVHPALAVVVTGLSLAFSWVSIRQTLLAHVARPVHDLGVLMGALGEARTDLKPVGSVYLNGELWSARAGSPLPEGTKIRVVARDGLMLLVEPAEPPIEA